MKDGKHVQGPHSGTCRRRQRDASRRINGRGKGIIKVEGGVCNRSINGGKK